MNALRPCAFLFTACVLGCATFAFAQDVAETSGFVGEITGNRVYVRSGPDQNYYPVTQLDAGARVMVVGESYGWLKIKPPQGCFSLIDKTYVDRGQGDLGVVNGNAVWVRTGSMMSPSKYARQLKLNRGDEVRIVGETEGHYKIVPPEEALIYVSADFVTRVSGDQMAAGDPGLTSVQPPSESGLSVGIGEASEAASPDGDVLVETQFSEETTFTPPGGNTQTAARPQLASATPPPTRAAPQIDYRSKMDAIESQISVEQSKPLEQQSFRPMIEQLRTLASNAADPTYTEYARVRMQQLEHREQVLRLYSGVSTRAPEVKQVLNQGEVERSNIVVSVPKPEPRFDVTGEFRKSMVFDNPVLPRRYKLIDPKVQPARTIAYVEVPRDASFDPDMYIGRFVGIIAERRFYQKGTVEAVEIFVPQQIVILNEAPIDVSGGATPMVVSPAPATTPVTQANAPVSLSGDGLEGDPFPPPPTVNRGGQQPLMPDAQPSSMSPSQARPAQSSARPTPRPANAEPMAVRPVP